MGLLENVFLKTKEVNYKELSEEETSKLQIVNPKIESFDEIFWYIVD